MRQLIKLKPGDVIPENARFLGVDVEEKSNFLFVNRKTFFVYEVDEPKPDRKAIVALNEISQV